MKYMWAVCDVEADGKYYAYPIRISVVDPLKRNAWAVFLYRGRQVCSYLLRNSNLGDKERMVELLARRYMTEPENIVVDIEFRD